MRRFAVEWRTKLRPTALTQSAKNDGIWRGQGSLHLDRTPAQRGVGCVQARTLRRLALLRKGQNIRFLLYFNVLSMCTNLCTHPVILAFAGIPG